MKKIFAAITALTFLICTASCGSNETTRRKSTKSKKQATEEVTEEPTTEKADKDLEEAYQILCNTFDEMTTISDCIHSAWHYGIYGDNQSYSGLQSETGLYSADFKELSKDIYYGLDIEILLDTDFNYCITLTIAALKSKYDSVNSDLTIAKGLIQQSSNELSNYNDMKNFYTKSLSYYEWLVSPTGNFTQASDTMQQYQSDLLEFKTSLEFDYGSSASFSADDIFSDNTPSL